jgi:hypothetical protein
MVWLADANTYVNVVTANKPKMLTGLTQNGNGGGRGAVHSPLVNKTTSRRRG